jgi:hypothetical protein
MTAPVRPAGFRGELLWELEIAARQITALAEAFPPENYQWRPDPQARSVSEVLVHVAGGNFMLLEFIGIAAPADLYPGIPSSGQERFAGFIRRNDELASVVQGREPAIALLKRSLDALRESFSGASDSELERPLHFFGEDTTVRRVYLRGMAHMHEHMGQLIAYLRFNGIPVPWPDWRPDRR